MRGRGSSVAVHAERTSTGDPRSASARPVSLSGQSYSEPGRHERKGVLQMRVGIMAACATAALLLASAPAAHAADFGDCPGVSGGNGRYMLKADASCDLSLLGDDAHVDLAGYTLSTTSGPSSVVHAVHVVLSGGSLRANGIYWMGGGGRMDHLDVSALGTGSPSSFFIEAGPDFTVTQSHFHDLPTSIAIDFYFSNNGSVSHSTFSHTRVWV